MTCILLCLALLFIETKITDKNELEKWEVDERGCVYINGKFFSPPLIVWGEAPQGTKINVSTLNGDYRIVEPNEYGNWMVDIAEIDHDYYCEAYPNNPKILVNGTSYEFKEGGNPIEVKT